MILTNRINNRRATRRRMKRGENMHFISKADCGATQSRIPEGRLAGVHADGFWLPRLAAANFMSLRHESRQLFVRVNNGVRAR